MNFAQQSTVCMTAVAQANLARAFLPWPSVKSVLQAALEGEPTWKTPRVPPAQSPGITPLAQEVDSQMSTTKAAPALPDAQLDGFVNDYVDSIVSKAKSELFAEALQSMPHIRSAQAAAPETPGSLAFTQGSSAGSTASPHKGQSGSFPARAPHRAQPSPSHIPLAQHAVLAGGQQQQGPAVAVSSTMQAATGSQMHTLANSKSSSQGDMQQEGQPDDGVSSSLQASAKSEVQAPSRDNRTAGSDDQGSRQLMKEGMAETASVGKQTANHELLLSEATDADADATRIVSEIVQEMLQAVSEHTHADQVSDWTIWSDSVASLVLVYTARWQSQGQHQTFENR